MILIIKKWHSADLDLLKKMLERNSISFTAGTGQYFRLLSRIFLVWLLARPGLQKGIVSKRIGEKLVVCNKCTRTGNFIESILRIS